MLVLLGDSLTERNQFCPIGSLHERIQVPPGRIGYELPGRPVRLAPKVSNEPGQLAELPVHCVDFFRYG